MRNHGIESYAIAQQYQLGVVLDPIQGDEDYTGMLVFPYLTKNGVRSLKFRRLDKGKSKNLYVKGIKHRLYNPAAYFASDGVIGIAEGEADAIAATEILGIPTIGIPGVESWKPNRNIWAPVFKNFDKVIVFTDGDPINPNTGLRPGEELGKMISEDLGWRAKIVASPEGEDVSSMIVAGREKELLDKFGSDEDDEEAD